MSKPDSPEDILADLHTERCAFKRFTARNSDDIVAATHYCEKYRREALTKLSEYYTNKFLECLPVPSQQTRGNTQNPDNPKYLTKFAAGYNQAIADTKQAIKQLSKEP